MISNRFPPYTVMLVDDHKIVRYGITAWLESEPDIRVIGSFDSSKELLAAMAMQPVDVVLIDFNLGETDIDGINLIRMIKLRHTECKVLVLSSHYTPATVALAMQNGSSGFYGKSQELDELAMAIRKVAKGQSYLHTSMAVEVANYLGSRPVSASIHRENKVSLIQHTSLSPKEQEVLRCFLNGLSVNDIADKFSRSANTISTQKQSAYRKLGIKTDSELFKLFNTIRDQ